MSLFLSEEKNLIDAANSAIKAELVAEFPEFQEILDHSTQDSDSDILLAERGLISENDLLNKYLKHHHVLPFDEQDFIPPGRLESLCGNYLYEQTLLPLEWNEEEIVFGLANPYQVNFLSYSLRRFTGKRPRFRFMRRSFIERMIRNLYLEMPEESTEIPEDEDHLLELAGEANIIRLVNEMLTQALERKASDIHIEPFGNQVAIRFRIDGLLQDYLHVPAQEFPALASRVKLVGNLNIAEKRLPQDGRTNFKFSHYDIDIRISTIPVMNGESIVMRLLHKDSMRFDLRELGMNEQLRTRFSTLAGLPHGIILVVGPTGSGKTTTLYSVMQQLNVASRKIITIEDPIEYQLDGLCQMQVNPKIGLTFAGGLRHIVRQDPDVILVGEIRDRETADIAINAALTGHLVLSTLHTNDAVGAITRLADMGVESFLVASSLCGVLSQRLVRKICPECHGASKLNGEKCRRCHNSGYSGRSGIYELLLVDDEIRHAITRQLSSVDINEIAVRNGMIPLLEDGRRKVALHETSEEELMRIASGI